MFLSLSTSRKPIRVNNLLLATIGSTIFLYISTTVATTTTTTTRINKEHNINDAASTVVVGTNNLRRRRQLSTEMFDPKTIETKSTDVTTIGSSNSNDGELSILTLGGSVTWGATLDDRYDAYPWLVGKALEKEGYATKVHVDNIAFRATGADFPSLCIESLIEEAGSAGRSYDMIMMDFVQNGTNGFPLLLKRLRKRFPQAVIVYVKLFSVKSNAMEEESGKMMAELGNDPNLNWIWRSGDVFNRGWQGTEGCGREICDASQIENLVKDAGGYIYNFPRPESPKTCILEKWFADDWHHLSKRGHEILTIGLMSFLKDGPNNNRLDLVVKQQPKLVGSWNGGDQCYNWFMNGKIPLSYTGAELKDLLKNMEHDEKWVLNVSSGGMGIEFDSKFNTPVPLGLGYMSREEPATYPKAQVVVNQDTTKAVVIDPTINRETGKTAHVTAFYHVGTAQPGHNIMSVTPLLHMADDHVMQHDPFRVVGVYLCGVCTEFGHLGSGAVNYAGHYQPQQQQQPMPLGVVGQQSQYLPLSPVQ